MNNNSNNYIFVLMPFGGEDDEIYLNYIKPICEHRGFTCKRADELTEPNNITKEIIKNIDKADIVIAELTGKNPNVYYELALAHAFNKPTIMLCRGHDQIPFDLLTFRIIIYENSAKGLRYLESNLSAMLDAFSLGRLNYDNPVSYSLKDNPFAAVYKTSQVLTFEENALKRVCVIAPDIALGPAQFREVMMSNLKRGVFYQYLLSGKDSVLKQFDEFVASLSVPEAATHFIGRVIEQDYVESDVTLIDPGLPSEMGFILAPAEHPDFHFRLIGGALFRIKERFDSLWFKSHERL